MFDIAGPEPAGAFAREREDTPSAASIQSDVLVTPNNAADATDPFVATNNKRSREEVPEEVEVGPSKQAKLDSSSPQRRARTAFVTVGLLATGAAIGAVSTVGLLASFY